MAPKKKTVERTAASSRPKRTPKPTTVATSSTPTPKPKKKTTATKKAAPKKVATGGVTKKTAPKKAATAKKAAPKKAAPKKAASKKAAPTYQKLVVKADGSNPLGAVGEKRIKDKKEKEAAAWAKHAHDEIELRYTYRPFLQYLRYITYTNGRDAGQFKNFNTWESFLKWSKEIDKQAWDKAHERKIGSLESDLTGKQAHDLKIETLENIKQGKNPHIRNMEDALYWREIEMERAKIMEEYRQKELKQHHRPGNVNGNSNGGRNGNGNGNGNVSAISSPVKKAQNAIVNASPVKKVQEAFAGGNRMGRSKSPEKKMTSNDSGYQADTEQQSVMGRTWELAANAVEAMRSAVVPE